jgi:cobalt-zinc-cadmium efflux system membrane fusion protein
LEDCIGTRMNTKKKWLFIAVLLACVAILMLWIFWRQSQPQVVPKQASAVSPLLRIGPDSLQYPEGALQLAMIRSQAIASSPVPVTDSLNARITYDEDVTSRIGVGISGRIVTIKAAPGDVVKAGQTLAEIDSPDVGTALADLSKARADESRKQSVLERMKTLVPGEAIAVKEWEAAKADYAQARAETARAELRVNNLNPRGHAVNGQRVRLASPMNGVVTERTATPALEVNPGMPAPLFVVTDPRRLWLMIDVPEKLMGSIKLGSSVAIESDAYPTESFSAKIVQLGQVVDPNTRRVVVRARLDNPASKLLPEMFVRASVLQHLGTGVSVPNSAIVNQGLYAFVFVQTARGQFQRRQVKLLTRGSDFSYLGDGVRGGESIVITGALLLDAELGATASDKP